MLRIPSMLELYDECKDDGPRNNNNVSLHAKPVGKAE